MTLPAVIGIPEAEALLLGSVLVEPARFGHVARAVMTDEFVDVKHRRVHAAILKVLAAGDVPDPAIVLAQMRRDGLEPCFLGDVGPGPFLHYLVTVARAPESAPAAARAVVEHAARRRIAEAGERIAQAAGSSAWDTLTELAAAELQAVTAAVRRAARGALAPIRGESA